MYERNICPICQAFQDPDTGQCLVCGKRYNYISNDPIILNSEIAQGPLDFCIPIVQNNHLGYVAFKGRPFFDVSYDGIAKTATFGVEIEANNDGDLLCFSL